MDKKKIVGKKNRLLQYGVLFVALIISLGSITYGVIIISNDGIIDSEYDISLFYNDAAYIVFKDGVDYYAINGSTGRIEIDGGTNASSVIQYCLDRVGGYGGLVLLREGSYGIRVPLEIYGNSWLKGSGQGASGKGTTLYLYEGADCDIINFEVEDGEEYTYFGGISDMTLAGTSSQQSNDSISVGVRIDSRHHYTTVERVHFQSFKTADYYIGQGAGYGHIITNCWLHGPIVMNFTESHYGSVRVTENVISEIYSGYEYSSIHLINACDKIISNNLILTNPRHGIYGETSYGLIIEGNEIRLASYGNTNTYDGIHLKKCHRSIVSNNIIGKTFATDSMRYGIYLNECNRINIVGNIVQFPTTAELGYAVITWANGYTYTNIKNNIGLNPVGYLEYPFRDTGTSLGINGNIATPTNNTLYRVGGFDLSIFSSGGSNVNITIYDADSYLIASGLTELTSMFLTVGNNIRFIYDTEPDVVVYAN